ncbi:MAG: hypothetical protein COW88_01110 [Candidatus Lloydbacteria bacterium CG22_combo_CG10-13_8_21_14_all_47_15]|uniref:Transposase IS30-like HTH domain-containing protein n=1 Tax=Candidatus Lloydbacteria bacterium CG22_combo_CG10-13_8_21_14_all_47_15 TaxID=1974635 RepID=A0A2H0CV16_9BACT|nr:MAG: hypothetical protein COW88_01110 [Candidatus Lloydbacteria bacterium CG22_combo_CG10-13_8_21_14_all_47_15]
MVKILEREKAKRLRAEGTSIGEIAKMLLVSKSTVSYWCRNISLTQKQIIKLSNRSKSAGTAALMRASERKRAERIKLTKESTKAGARAVGKLSNRDIFMLGLALYWGEGYKSGNEEFGFTNSDRNIICLYVVWLEKVYRVNKKDLILRISINSLHKNRVSDVIRYWSKILNVPRSQFTKTSLIKTETKKRYTNMNEHFGTLRVKVRRGTSLRRQVLGSIEEVARQALK